MRPPLLVGENLSALIITILTMKRIKFSQDIKATELC